MTPSQIKQARKDAGLTQTQAGRLVGGSKRTWQDWEYGKRNMPAAKWELFRIKSGLEKKESKVQKQPFAPFQ